MSGFKPTQEQQSIIKEAQLVDRLKINAAAGSGKTSTLTLLANAIQKPSLYIAFNKAIAREAYEKFPDHVICKTTHSLAYGSFGHQLAGKLKRAKGRYKNVAVTSSEIAKYYKLKDMKSGEKIISANAIGLMVKETVKRFEASADQEITRSNISWRQAKELFPDSVERDIALSVVELAAKKLWKDRIDVHSDVLATHNTYLKLFQLSKPVLDYEVIYLDEAQDSNDVVLDIFTNQKHAKLIAVGDSYQAIYGWNGAVNAMKKLQYPCKELTKSFRFGQTIADVARAVIRGGIDVKGFEKVNSRLDYVDTSIPYTIIYRTNAALLDDAVSLLRSGETVSVEVDTNDFIKQLQSAEALLNGDMNNVKHDMVIPYSSWSDYVKAKDESPEIGRVVSIVEQGRVGTFVSALRGVKKDDNAHVTLTTCHKSKGREWDQVILAGDFREVAENTNQEELNLIYVGVTRAMKVLQINSSVESALELWEDIKHG